MPTPRRFHLQDLLDGRVVFVTGKGGTGKTTLAVALGRLAATQGRRVVIAEMDNHRPSLTEYFDIQPPYDPERVAPNLSITNITWIEALADWLTGVVPASRIVRLILSNRMVRLFLDVTPGSREMVIFARILSLMRSHDLVVVDLPASGHAVSFFLAPYRSLLLFLSGPIHKLAAEIVETLRGPSVRILLVSLPEEIVVNETLETAQALAELAPELTIGHVVLNQGLEPTLSVEERTLLGRLAARVDLDSGSGEWVLAGLWEADREETTGEARERIQRETGARVLTVPLLVTQGGPVDVADRVEAVLRRSLFPEARS